MLRNIDISELTVDMYVAEITSDKSETMPKKKKGMIRDHRIISKFIEIGIERVVIDTEKGLDVPAANDKPEKRVLNQAVEEKIAQFKKLSSIEHQTLPLEWGSAKEIFRTAASIILETKIALLDGKAINIAYFDEAAKAISNSIMRNKDALTWLGKIRIKNNYLYEHSVNSATLMGIFAQAQGLNITQIQHCITGALLHDLGQTHIQEEFFERAGPLSLDEFEEVKQHVNFGVDIIEDEKDIHPITKNIIYEHHERYDGSGYPQGLKGEDISLFGRMFAIVDTYDALTNNRNYQAATPSSLAMRTLLELSKTHFDESLVHQFIKCMGVYPTGTLTKLSNGLLAIVIAQNPGATIRPMVKVIFNYKNNCYIEPFMIDLVKESSDLKIMNYEDPDNYGINIDDFMPNEIH